MNVVLLHEYSGVHTELKQGLQELGVGVKTANLGDLQRGFPTDLNIGTQATGLRGTLDRAWRQLQLHRIFRNADILQSIASTPFNPLVSHILGAMLFHRTPSRFVYLAAGSDAVYRLHCKKLRYWPPHDWYENSRRLQTELRVVSRAQRIIAGAWDYEFVYAQQGFATTYIPFPAMTAKVQFREIGARRRLRVFHPLNRDPSNDFKGTTHIRHAFERLEKKFRNDVEFVAAGQMPFHQYMEFVEGVDVVVDQANSFSYGMSAVYAMAQGKVVLSGLETEAVSHPGYRGCPVINIRPDAVMIEMAIEELLADRTRLVELGHASRAYAVERHDAVRVAEQYLSTYRELTHRG